MKNACKCGAKLFLRNGLPVSKLCPNCRKKKEELKKEKHKTTKKYQEAQFTKLQKETDRLYQELGRLKYEDKGCLVCGREYSCLHHFILKSQSLNTRYNISNGVPICIYCHTSLHKGQNSEIVGKIIQIKGLKWFDKLTEEKHKLVLNKTEHVNNAKKELESLIENFT